MKKLRDMLRRIRAQRQMKRQIAHVAHLPQQTPQNLHDLMDRKQAVLTAGQTLLAARELLPQKDYQTVIGKSGLTDSQAQALTHYVINAASLRMVIDNGIRRLQEPVQCFDRIVQMEDVTEPQTAQRLEALLVEMFTIFDEMDRTIPPNFLKPEHLTIAAQLLGIHTIPSMITISFVALFRYYLQLQTEQLQQFAKEACEIARFPE